MEPTEEKKGNIEQGVVESQEDVEPVSKRSSQKKAVFLWLSILFLMGIAVGGYFVYQMQQHSFPVAKVATKKTFGYAPSSKAPGESYIVDSPTGIHLTTDLSIPARHIIVPDFKTTFNVPIELRTGQELHSSIHDEANAGSVIRMYRDNTKYTKDRNGYDTADNTIIFSFDFPYGTDPIDSTGQELNNFKNTNTSILNSISFKDSPLSSESAAFLKYFDTLHLRYDNKNTDTYKGYIQMDVATKEGRHVTFGIIYTCYDQVYKDLCSQTFQMFVSSLQFDGGSFDGAYPWYTESDVFSLLKFVKKNLNTENELYLFDSLFTKSFYREEKVPAIAVLNDDDLQQIRCLPQQLFAYDAANRSPIYTMGVNMPSFADANLKNILSTLQSKVPSGYMLSQFTACQTEDKKYLIKYNVNLQNTTRTKNDVLHAKIAILDEKGNFEDIVDIPNTYSYCSHFIALTKDNILYFACVPFFDQQVVGIDMYKIDIAKKSYDKVYSCMYPSTDNAKVCK